MEVRRPTLKQIADLICGNEPDASKFFVYRSSSYLTEFFEEIDREEFVHDGSTRQWRGADALAQILGAPSPEANVPPESFARAIAHPMAQEDKLNSGRHRPEPRHR